MFKVVSGAPRSLVETNGTADYVTIYLLVLYFHVQQTVCGQCPSLSIFSGQEFYFLSPTARTADRVTLALVTQVGLRRSHKVSVRS